MTRAIPRARAFWRTLRQRSSASNAAPVADLVKWADIVDGALYESADPR